MTTASDLLGQKASDDNELSYTDKQVRIIEQALENAELSAADLHQHLLDEWGDEDAPSQGYIYNVLQRATSKGYKAATGQLEEEEPETETQQIAAGEGGEVAEMEDKAEEEDGEDEASATVQRSGGTITISISLPEDADVKVVDDGGEEKEELLA